MKAQEVSASNSLYLTPTFFTLNQAQLGKVADVGFKQAMVQKWLALEKGEVPTVVRKVIFSIKSSPQVLRPTQNQG